MTRILKAEAANIEAAAQIMDLALDGRLDIVAVLPMSRLLGMGSPAVVVIATGDDAAMVGVVAAKVLALGLGKV